MAITNIATVYPPIIPESAPAFLYNTDLVINFTVPLVVNIEDVDYIAVRITRVDTGRSVVNINNFYDGIIYITKSFFQLNNFEKGNLIIKKEWIKEPNANSEGWDISNEYKIQIRFGYYTATSTSVEKELYINSLFENNDEKNFWIWVKSDLNHVSEWSNIMITRSIPKYNLEILNNNIKNSNIVSELIQDYNINIESNRFPTFEASYNLVDNNLSLVEAQPVQKYKFNLYKQGEEEIYLTSGWLLYKNIINQTNKHFALMRYQFSHILEEDVFYELECEVETVDLYYLKTENRYTFKIQELLVSDINNLRLIIKDNSNSNSYKTIICKEVNENNAKEVFDEYTKLFMDNFSSDIAYARCEDGIIYYKKDESSEEFPLTRQERISKIEPFYQSYESDENALISIYLKNNPIKQVHKENLNGKYILIRSSEKTNFAIWDNIAEFIFYDEATYNTRPSLLYEDFAVESGVKYKYALTKVNSLGVKSKPKYEGNTLEDSASHFSNFEYSYLYCNGIQIKLNYDVKMQSFKRTRFFQKVDTLNSQYPVILRNGMSNYAEFQLGAKITMHSDDFNSFFYYQNQKNNESGYFYNGNLVISNSKFYTDIPNINTLYKDDVIDTFTTNSHSKDNVYIERIYRTYVEQFLNDGGYKLYKSPTEGNFIVTLTNVTLQPNQQLGRLISDFTSTAYEVLENNVKNLQQYNINPINVVTNNMRLMQTFFNDQMSSSFGQVRNVFDGKFLQNYLSVNPALYDQLLLSELNIKDMFQSKREIGKIIKYKSILINLPEGLVQKIEEAYQEDPEHYFYDIDEKKQELFISPNTYNKLLNEDVRVDLYFQPLKEPDKIIEYFCVNHSIPYQIMPEILKIASEKLEYEYNYKTQCNNPYFHEDYDNIIKWIKDQEETVIGIENEKKYKIKNIKSIKLELYPYYDAEQELFNLQLNQNEKYFNKNLDSLTDQDRIDALNRQLQIAKYKLILQQYEESQSNPITVLVQFEGEQTLKEFVMFAGREYVFSEKNIQKMYLKYARPVIINYEIEKTIEDNPLKITYMSKGLKCFGQLNGLFTNNQNIINNHTSQIPKNSYEINENLNYNIYTNLNINNLIYERVHDMIYNSYKNILVSPYIVKNMEVINYLQEEHLLNISPQQQIYDIILLKESYEPLLNYGHNDFEDIWVTYHKNSYVLYQFVSIPSIEIEGDQNTEFIINPIYDKNNNIIGGERKIIGPTCKYKINFNEIIEKNNYEITFTKPCFCVVNFEAEAKIEIKGYQEGLK